jgi:hypothetical protein
MHRDSDVVLDGEGDELENIGCAEEAAIDFATATARDRFKAGSGNPVIVSVRDAGGQQILKVTLTCAVER